VRAAQANRDQILTDVGHLEEVRAIAHTTLDPLCFAPGKGWPEGLPVLTAINRYAGLTDDGTALAVWTEEAAMIWDKMITPGKSAGPAVAPLGTMSEPDNSYLHRLDRDQSII